MSGNRFLETDSFRSRFNSIESVEKTRNKFLLRTCLKKFNFPSPWFNRFSLKENPKNLIKKTRANLIAMSKHEIIDYGP